MAAINDLVLVHIDNKAGFYARIEEITPDIKPRWWQVKLLALTIPAQIYTWILDESQLNGASFTMGGTPVQLEKVALPDSAVSPTKPENLIANEEKRERSKVVSLLDRKKDK